MRSLLDTEREVPGAVDVGGIARTDASVTVNGVPATRQGEYFWRELGVSHSSNPVWQQVTQQASHHRASIILFPGSIPFGHEEVLRCAKLSASAVV